MLPAPETEKLEGIQAWLGVEFPPDFLTFLQSHNGYQPDEPKVIQGERVLVRFLPLLSKAQSDQHLPDAEWAYELSSTASLIDGRLFIGDGETFTYVPIAELAFGDLVCLDYSQPGSPAIAIWDHEQSEDSAAVATRIADTLTDFLTQNGLEFLLP